jgi:hypothetical protein
VAAVHQFKINLSGWQGGPGINTWYAIPSLVGSAQMTPTELTAASSGFNVFYTAVRAYLIGGMAIAPDTEVKILDSATGELTGVVTMPTFAVSGSGSGNEESRATQIKLRILTNLFANGRRVKGGPFIGPASNLSLGPDGQLTATAVTTISTALNTFLNTAVWGVWHRPKAGAGGEFGVHTSGTVSSVPGTLRRRKT